MPLEGGWQTYSYQDPDVLSQAAAVQNTWYPFTTLTNARIYQIAVATTSQNETLEVRIVADGVTIPADGIACTDGQENQAYIVTDAVNGVEACTIETNVNHQEHGSHIIDGNSIVVSLRKTTAAGASELEGLIRWGQLTNA